ncbi:hypothetical protein [Massilia luteola]|jgi:hypothetical protein|uniref:hypothetical protein n=1 Tax=Massilia luteola TaxID=3081751 RepID=UPI002ACC00E2|nr:hypothetical protein [Massilia sp. Gc5]
MLQALLATTGVLAIAASIAAKFVAPPARFDDGDGAGADDPSLRRRRRGGAARPGGMPASRRRGACAGQRFSCDRSRTAPRSADVVSAA